MKKDILNKLVLSGALVFIIVSISFKKDFLYQVLADENPANPNINFSINLDRQTIARGYTVNAFNNGLKLSLVPGILSDQTNVEIIDLKEKIDLPWELDNLSGIYQFEFKNKSAYDNTKPFYIQVSYDKQDNNFKQVLFYDKSCGCWRPLPTIDYPEEKFVRSLIHLPFARIAVFSYPNVLTIGKASWYKYKGGNFAASPDFPKGSQIMVTNISNNKSVKVTINDYGPDRLALPNRVIDLDSVAFSKIASLGAGIVNVKINPISITPSLNSGLYNNIGNLEKKYYTEPIFLIKSAIIFDETNDIPILSKDSTSTSALASLTKLIAIKTFLDTKPTLTDAVAYSIKDENYNYEYCKPWESSKLKISDGETLTIEDLVYTSLIGSTNNTIESLVRVSGLERGKFIGLMNQYVASIGAVNTFFVEPTGLSPENISSPYDYAIITKDLFKNPIIQKASTMNEYIFTTINKGIDHRIKNTNKFIELNRFKITASKTGYLDEAGYCLMTRVENPKGNIIVITFGANTRQQSFQVTNDLINYGLRKINDKIL